MGTHTLIYLDLNYLSNMAKAHSDSPTSKGEGEFWSSLFDGLKRAVLSDRVACPELEFQRDEAEFDQRIEYPVWQVVCELSLGLEFLPWETILELQIEDAAFRFAGRSPPRRESWQSAFKSNPHAPVASRMACNAFVTSNQTRVHLSPPGEVIDHDRQMKRRWKDTARSLLKQPAFADPHKELLVQKSAFIDNLLGRGALKIVAKQWASDNLLHKLTASRNWHRLIERLTRLERIGIRRHNMTDFVNSGDLLNVPFIDVFCSIDTAIVQHYKDRKPEGGDLFDAAILSTVLPYCDVVTTDRFMKDVLVNRLGFDDKYKCEVFSARQQDRLAFEQLLKDLS